MTNLDVTLTLAEYVRRMSSADASEWLPTPAETVVCVGGERVVLIEDVGVTSASPYYRCTYGLGHFWATPDTPVTVSLLTY